MLSFREWLVEQDLNEGKLDYHIDHHKITNLLLDLQSFLEMKKYKIVKISNWNSKYLDGNFVDDMIIVVNKGNHPFRTVTVSDGKESMEFTINLTSKELWIDFKTISEKIKDQLDSFFSKNKLKKIEKSSITYSLKF